MNFTLEITASPELLGVLNVIASGITKGAEAKKQENAIAAELCGASPTVTTTQVPQANYVQSFSDGPVTSEQPFVAPTAPPNQPSVQPTYSQASIPVNTPPANIPQQAPIAAPPTYTIADLQTACAPLMDAGRQQELITLLSNFGVDALTKLPKERVGEFATALRAMGAQI